MATLCRHLDRAMFELQLAVVDLRGAVYQGDIPPDVTIVDLKARRVRTALPRIVRLLWRTRPHIVFSTLGQLNLALAICKSFLPRDACYVAREASIVSLLPSIYTLPRWWLWAYKRFYHRFNMIVCQSRAMRDDLVKNFGVPEAKTVVINNPVDIEQVNSLASKVSEDLFAGHLPPQIKLVAAGTLIPVKGFDVLLRALALTSAMDFQLIILGEGPLRGELEQLSASLGVASRVRFAGFASNPYAYFRQADAFVLCSVFEGFPNAVLEALACGTPVVATPGAGGVLELLNSVDGCVVAQDRSEQALANALRRIDRRRVPTQALSQYSVSNIVKQYQAVFSACARSQIEN